MSIPAALRSSFYLARDLFGVAGELVEALVPGQAVRCALGRDYARAVTKAAARHDAEEALAEVEAEHEVLPAAASPLMGDRLDLKPTELTAEQAERLRKSCMWCGTRGCPSCRAQCTRCGGVDTVGHECLRDSSPVASAGPVSSGEGMNGFPQPSPSPRSDPSPPTVSDSFAVGGEGPGSVRHSSVAQPGHPELVELIAEVLDAHQGRREVDRFGQQYCPCTCGSKPSYDFHEFNRDHLAPLIAEQVEKATPSAPFTHDDLAYAAGVVKAYAAITPELPTTEVVSLRALAHRLAEASDVDPNP